MKKTITLAALLLGNSALAEDQECIDSIALDIQIDQIPYDLVSEAYSEDKLEEQLINPVRDLFNNKLKIPIEVKQFRVYQGICEKASDDNTITIVYTTPEQYVKDCMPNYENFTEFVIRNIDGEDKEEFIKGEEEIEKLPDYDKNIVKKELHKSVVEGIERKEGWTDISNRTIYLFPLDNETNYSLAFNQSIPNIIDERTYIGVLARNINHEIGHILLGKGHSNSKINDDGSLDLMYNVRFSNNISTILAGNYNFSDNDQELIITQRCEGEKQ